MDPAPPVEAPDGIRLAPPLHRLGPFLGGVVLCESLQGAHELAVDEPVESGSRSPETIATPTSSSRARPSRTSPPRIRSRASATRPIAHAAGSHLEPTSIARPAHFARQEVTRQHPLVRSDRRKPRVRRRLTLTLE